MPTKLAEFFATGIAPIGHGANSEVTDWVRRAGSGLALDDLSIDSLERAAEFVAKGVPRRRCPGACAACRGGALFAGFGCGAL